MRRKTLKKRNTRKRTRKQKGGDPLPNSSKLTLEFLFNDFMNNKFERYFLNEAAPEEIEEKQKENKLYIESITAFINDIKETNGIPYSISTDPPKSLIKYIREHTREEDNVCKGKVEFGKINESFYAQRPAVCVMLKDDDTIIGIAVFSFTHRHILHKFGMKMNTSKVYINIDWLCGSKYTGVGSIIIKTIEKIQEYMKTESIYLISYDSAIPFYQKMNFTYLGLSRVGTPMMEKKRKNNSLTPSVSINS